jgi:hypothetical protein
MPRVPRPPCLLTSSRLLRSLVKTCLKDERLFTDPLGPFISLLALGSRLWIVLTGLLWLPEDTVLAL